MAQTDKGAPDWERIEADYRAGILSLREIGEANGCSHVAVSKRAKARGWPRDLKAKIQAKADALVNKAVVTAQVNAATLVRETETVEAGALAVARIRLSHRTDIARFRRLVVAMLEEIEAETGDIALFHELGEMLRSDDEKGQGKRNDLYMKVISSAQRIDSLKKLSETLRTLVALERESYGIAEAQAPQDTDHAALLKAIAARLPD